MKYQITTKTSEQIAAAFEAVFKDIEPPAVITPEVWLAPYRKAVLAQRERGLSWEQIAQGMRGPSINEKVTARMLGAVFGAKAGRASRRKTAKRKPRGATATNAQPNAPVSAPATGASALPT